MNSRESNKVTYLRSSPLDVGVLDQVESGEDTGAGDSSEDVCSGALHHRHESLVAQNLHAAVDGTLVVHSRARRHHHSATDGVDGVGGESRDDRDGPSEEEGGQEALVLSEDDRLERIVKTEIKTAVDEDSNAGDDESSVQTSDAVSGQSLLVDIDQSIVLSLAVFALGVVGESRSGVVKRVNGAQGERSGESSGSNVSGEFGHLRCVF